jgi:hypothetical protein
MGRTCALAGVAIIALTCRQTLFVSDGSWRKVDVGSFDVDDATRREKSEYLNRYHLGGVLQFPGALSRAVGGHRLFPPDLLERFDDVAVLDLVQLEDVQARHVADRPITARLPSGAVDLERRAGPSHRCRAREDRGHCHRRGLQLSFLVLIWLMLSGTLRSATYVPGRAPDVFVVYHRRRLFGEVEAVPLPVYYRLSPAYRR